MIISLDERDIILHSQYHIATAGEARSQAIRNHDIDLFVSKYSRIVPEKICISLIYDVFASAFIIAYWVGST